MQCLRASGNDIYVVLPLRFFLHGACLRPLSNRETANYKAFRFTLALVGELERSSMQMYDQFLNHFNGERDGELRAHRQAQVSIFNI